MLLVDELSLEFHCVLQLQDRSRNVNSTFMSGWIMSSSYIFGGSLAALLRFAGLQHAFWKEALYKMRFGEIADARNVVFFNTKDGSEPGKASSAERR